MKLGSIFMPFFLTLAVIAGIASAEPVRVDGGLIEGVVKDNISIWQGIPYAAPPVGGLRWRAPQAVVPWTGVRDTTAFSPACRQTVPWIKAPQNEDCLYLNIWAPAVPKGGELPVMVWLYGGGFYFGTAAQPLYDGANMARHGVIVVTLNYRVGVFGFFSHPDLAQEGKVNGNQGLLDQVAALQWVRRNIAAFGGDPHRVTIFGESAGATSVGVLMTSPLAKGLFQRAIAQSGASVIDAREARRFNLVSAEASGVSLGKALNALHLAELRKLDADTLVQQPWSPDMVVDGYLVPNDMTAAYKKDPPRGVPLLVGWNADEGKDLAGEMLADRDLSREHFPELAEEIIGHAPSQALFDAYPVKSDVDVKPTLFRLMTDDNSWHMWKWAELHTAAHGGPVYVYDFIHIPAEPTTPCSYSCGAGHGAEIPFVFDQLAQDPRVWTPDDHLLAERMITYWTNFAKAGNPNGPGLPTWKVFEGSDGSVIRLGSGVEVGSAPPLPNYKLIEGDRYAQDSLIRARR